MGEKWTPQIEMRQGDSLERLKDLELNSIDALVTDPPAGISFMGKDWDGDKGGSEEWISWLSSILKECHRVMKPGAHGLVWAIPRTSHWTARACELAGFEVRDCITHLFGSGFPKSLDVSKAIDKAAGAERKIVGYENYSAPDIRGNSYDQAHVSGRDRLGVPVTEATTDAAKQWQGFGTALKPAAEFWWLIRKPISEKTVAANVLKWGTGALNIDGCSIVAEDQAKLEKNWDRVQSVGAKGNASGAMGLKQVDLSDRAPAGRFPANLVLSHSEHCTFEDVSDRNETGRGIKTEKQVWHCAPGCAVRALDEQSLAGGMHSAGRATDGRHTPSKGSFGPTTFKASGGMPSVRIGDSGGASRFFFQSKYYKDDACHRPENATLSANSARIGSSLLEPTILDFVQRLAAIGEALEDKQLRDLTTLFTSDIQSKSKSDVKPSTPLILSTVEKYLHELKHIESLTDSPAKAAEIQKLIDITTTTLNLLTFDGYAESVTLTNTPANLVHGARVSASRFLYCAKVSPSERNAGLDGFPKREAPGSKRSEPAPGRISALGAPRENHHPTVKPLKLMRYFCKLITPPGGCVLDPFMGSGSTGVAAKQSGFGFVGVEREKEYFDIAKARVDSAPASRGA